VKCILALVAVVGILGLTGTGAHAQHPNAGGPMPRVPYLDFSDDATAEQVVREIMEAIGMPARSVTVRPGHVPTARARVEPIVPPSAAPSRPVNSGLGDLVLIVTCLYSGVW